MNEELKIIIKAVTDTAKKDIQEVRKEVEKLGSSGEKSGGKFSKAMGAVATGAKVAIASITAITTALVTLGKSTEDLRKNIAKLNTAFMAAGSSAEQAGTVYKDLYRFLGDSDKAVEAGAHLAKLTTNEEELAQWTTTLQGVYASFGDSIPIEGLTEAANESARTGKVTGVLADALNWAGVSEDAFNASLAQTNSLAEREALIRGTLNGLYADAAAIYEQNNGAMLAQNEAQANLNMTLVRVGNSVAPLITAMINLSNAILTALAPAIKFISNVLAYFINMISKAVQWVSAFFGILSGDSEKAAANTNNIANNIGSIGGSLADAGSGADALEDGLTGANEAAEKLKRTTAGFDELNKITNPNTSSSGSSGSGGGYAGGGEIGSIGSFALDTSGFTTALDESSAKVETFVDKCKKAIDTLKDVFAPTITAWKDAFKSIDWETIGGNFLEGFGSIKSAFSTLGSYVLEEFIPNIVNSFSTNLAPMFGDIFNFALTEGSALFADYGAALEEWINSAVLPVGKLLEDIFTDIFDGAGSAWKKYGKPFLDEASKAINGIKDTVKTFWNKLLKPIIDLIITNISTLWKKSLKPLWNNVTEAVLEISTNLLKLYNKVLLPLLKWILDKIYPVVKKVVEAVLKVVSNVVTGVSKVANGIITVLRGILNTVTGAFTGNWKQAWNGIKQIFKGAFEALWTIAKTPLNLIIGAVNTVIKGIVKAVNTAITAINKLSFTVPSWVPSLGGKTFGFNIKTITATEIPKLATGGIVTSSILANIGERGKEAVLPLENNTEWMDMLADRIAARNGAPSKIVLTLDGKELGWANIKAINNITKQTGKLQLLV